MLRRGLQLLLPLVSECDDEQSERSDGAKEKKDKEKVRCHGPWSGSGGVYMAVGPAHAENSTDFPISVPKQES